jgi:hypothetical protein
MPMPMPMPGLPIPMATAMPMSMPGGFPPTQILEQVVLKAFYGAYKNVLPFIMAHAQVPGHRYHAANSNFGDPAS